MNGQASCSAAGTSHHFIKQPDFSPSPTTDARICRLRAARAAGARLETGRLAKAVFEVNTDAFSRADVILAASTTRILIQRGLSGVCAAFALLRRGKADRNAILDRTRKIFRSAEFPVLPSR